MNLKISTNRFFNILAFTSVFVLLFSCSKKEEPKKEDQKKENEPIQISTPDGLANLSSIIITTNGTYDFGPTGPSILYYEDLSNNPATLPAKPILGKGKTSFNAQGAPLIEDVPELPYGKGIVIGNIDDNNNGSKNKQIKVVDVQAENQFYEFHYFYYPADHQDNSLKFLNEGCTWNLKGIWHFNSSDGYSARGIDDPDIFAGAPLYYSPGQYWAAGYKIVSNKAPTSSTDRTSCGMLNMDTKTWIDVPMCRQLWAKLGPVAGSTEEADGFYQLTTTEKGIVEQKDYENAAAWTGSENTNLVIDRFHLPGYARGFNVASKAYCYFSQVYETTGPGAPARVEITDNADYASSKKHTICTIDEWSSTEIKATIRTGIFYSTGVSGMHVHVFDSNNNYIVYAGKL